MLTTDPIADLLTRIRNAIMARRDQVWIPHSRIKESLVRILKEADYISHYVVEDEKTQKGIKIFLKYDLKKKSPIHHLQRVSKPGGRIYKGFRELRPLLEGMGLRILSTPKGLLTDRQAKQAKVGGEVICEVY